MSHLHTVNSAALMESCLGRVQTDDSLLLLEDAVYCVFDRQLIEGMPAGVSIHVLQDDLDARGITIEGGDQGDKLSAVTMAEFVTLCCDHDKVINWF